MNNQTIMKFERVRENHQIRTANNYEEALLDEFKARIIKEINILGDDQIKMLYNFIFEDNVFTFGPFLD